MSLFTEKAIGIHEGIMFISSDSFNINFLFNRYICFATYMNFSLET